MSGENQEDDIKFDPSQFQEACEKLYSKWSSDETSDAWGASCDALVLVAGSTNDDVIKFPKSSALQVALFAIELSDTLIAFCENRIVILAASKKAKLAQDLADNLDSSFKFKLQVLTRNKADKDAENFAKVIENLKSSKNGNKVGTLLKEKNDGAFAAGWEAALKNSHLATGDIASGIGDVLAVKTPDQLKSVRDGSSVAIEAIRKHVIEDILNLIDDKKEASMQTLMEGVEDQILALAKEKKFQEADMEIITQPILQSGGEYDLKYTAQTSNSSLHLPDKDVPAVHIISISLRYKFCCCTVARTLFFNAKKDQADNYKLLLEVFEDCVAVLKPGVRLNKVYEKAASFLKGRKPELLNNMVKELGWGMGYELRDKRLVLDEKNRHQAEKGMIFCLRLGLENLKQVAKDPKSQKYSILIQDTVIIGDEGAEIVTGGLHKKFSKCSWNVSDEPNDEPKKSEKKIDTADILAKLGDQKTRKVSESEEAEARKLFEEQNQRLAQEGIKKQKQLILGETDKDSGGSKAVTQTSGYASPEDFPLKTSGSLIHVDEDRKTILVPINGVPVPFHVSVVKNVAKQEAGGFSVIRINFVTPGLGITLNSVEKGLMYLRELSYRSQDSANFSLIHKQISDMKKHFSQNETLMRAQAELVPQEPVRLNPNRAPALQNVRIYPNIQARGKKTEGNLEAHVNGFRFNVKKAPSADLRHVDFLYRNVRHAFFQPSCKSSTIILLHFRLINPIMVGKTSTKDLQFYVEYMDEGESLMDNRKRNAWDRDEIEDESKHKQMIAELDNQFKKFTERVNEQLPAMNPNDPDGGKIWEWDIPYQELEFQGNPKNAMVELYPTTSCIVHLATKPVCIIDLDRVDVVYYERIQSGNRNFDLVFVYKDFLLPEAKIQEGVTWTRINSIDIRYYDQVREVVQKSKLPQFEGALPLKWNDVLKQYKKNFEDITNDGGWQCILGALSDDEGEEDPEEDDDESFTADSASSEASSEDASDDSDLSEYSEDDSDDVSDEDLSSEGMDSDEAERWAEEEDRRRPEKAMVDPKRRDKRDRSPDSDDDRPRKKGSAPPPKKGSAPPPKKGSLPPPKKGSMPPPKGVSSGSKGGVLGSKGGSSMRR